MTICPAGAIDSAPFSDAACASDPCQTGWLYRIDGLCRSCGAALPNTATILRLKVAFGGICGVGAGLLFMASGPDGSLAWGALMAACSIVLNRNRRRQSRPRRPEEGYGTGEVGLPRRDAAPAGRIEVPARRAGSIADNSSLSPARAPRRSGDLPVVCGQPAPGARAVAAALRPGHGAQGRGHGLDRGAGDRGGEPTGPAGGRAVGQRCLRQHRDAGAGIRRAGGGCRSSFFSYRQTPSPSLHDTAPVHPNQGASSGVAPSHSF